MNWAERILPPAPLARRITRVERRARHADRDAAWIALYREGKTLQEIGTQYGFTREYIRQRLALNGIRRLDSARHAASAARIAEEEANRGRRAAAYKSRLHERAYGISQSEWDAIAREFGPKVFEAYRCTRNNVRRNIAADAWQLTFLEWLNIWRASGKWPERSRRAFSLLRLDPFGPYRANNVFVGKQGDHVRRLHKMPEWRAKWEAGVAAKNLATDHA